MPRSLRFVLIPLVLALAALAASSLVFADEGDIEVMEATAESQFPDGIMFRVKAESKGVIASSSKRPTSPVAVPTAVSKWRRARL